MFNREAGREFFPRGLLRGLSLLPNLMSNGLIPGVHTMKGENRLPELSFDFHRHAVVIPLPQLKKNVSHQQQRGGEIAQWVKALAAEPDGPSLTHMVEGENRFPRVVL